MAVSSDAMIAPLLRRILDKNFEHSIFYVRDQFISSEEAS
jgi:hypothetical protein